MDCSSAHGVAWGALLCVFGGVRWVAQAWLGRKYARAAARRTGSRRGESDEKHTAQHSDGSDAEEGLEKLELA